MSIGREPGTGMRNEWASSGCRLPVVVQCDFKQENDQTNIVAPLTGEVRFTGPDGEVLKPVERGEWSLVGGRDLSFTLGFPEELVRRDVTLGGVVRLEGLLYSVDDLKAMDEKFYEARNDRWDAGEALNDVDRRKNAPKIWNPNTNQWEERDDNEGFFSELGKKVNLLIAERSEREVNRERPMPKELSLDCGPFPGVEGDVYFRKGGKVLLKRGFMREDVIGTWSAEPINDKPLSYY
eukprot:CAMPEP_0197188792 /NCGR_PEP_ID=MMETSP1423-20130617/18508_1 /TAXON_ID=476441 /ORGANISM="Pseudo-nitzschia heimii, Strain UNC1101" /LENGTH=236 /DNA_ID=CAMNT_0042640737 /DNA_START=57 /DNA_END=767 /DNA_ORIENTATION=+